MDAFLWEAVSGRKQERCRGGRQPTPSVSVVVAATDDFLASGPQKHRVLPLGRERAFDVAKRRVRLHHTLVAQVLRIRSAV